MLFKQSAKRSPEPQSDPDSIANHKHPVFETDQRNKAIKRLLGETEWATENDLEFGYDPNDSTQRQRHL